MKYFTYVLYSKNLSKHYVGSTSDVDKRVVEHNSGKSKFTCRAKDWELVKSYEFVEKSDALKLEIKIKNRGCRRFLEAERD